MSFTAITSTEIEAGKPVKESLFTKVKDNFDDHESRITANAVSLENKYGSSFFNLGASYSVASDALTITIKQQDGSTDPTAGSPARVAIRSATATSATYSIVDIESGINIIIPKGATLGGTNAVLERYYLYVLSNSGTPEVAVSGTLYDDSYIVTTVAISAASDTRTTVYSNSARTNLPIRPIGFFEVTTSTSGDWVAPSKVFTGSPEQITDLVELSGVSRGSVDLGTFTGSTISDNTTIKGALQEIETQVDTNVSAIAAQPSNVGIAGNASGDDTRTGTSYETMLSCTVTTGASGAILLNSYGVMRVEGTSGYTGTMRIKVGSDTSANVAPRLGVGSVLATSKTLDQADSLEAFNLRGIWTGLAAYTTYTCYLEMKHDNSAVDLWGIQSGGVLEAFGS